MKKLIFLVVILGVAALIAYKLLSKDPPKEAEKKAGPMTISKNSDAFNASFSTLLNDYYSLKDALVEWDSVKANTAATALQNSSDSLHFSDLKADPAIIETAKSFAISLKNDAKGLVGESGLEQKRREFNIMTDELYNLVRTVRYDREIIYHIKCPMAFKDSEEAYWAQ